MTNSAKINAIGKLNETLHFIMFPFIRNAMFPMFSKHLMKLDISCTLNTALYLQQNFL